MVYRRFPDKALAPLLGFAGSGLMCLGAATLTPFYRIERYLDVGILLHFDTAENRRYDVQCTTNFAALQQPPNLRSADWTTIYTVDAFPFIGHYVLLEPTTNAPAVRFYRLVVTP